MKRIGLILLLLLALCQSANAQLLNRALQGERRLPTTFYADCLDPTVHTINVPPGRYNLENGPIVIHDRSDLSINFNGSTLLVNGAQGAGATYRAFYIYSTLIDAGYPGVGQPSADPNAWSIGAVTDSDQIATFYRGNHRRWQHDQHGGQ